MRVPSVVSVRRVHVSHRSAAANPERRTEQKVRLDCFSVEYDDGRVTATRVPQEERTRAMRQRLLEACVECLVERGWSGTSTTLVSQRAGVSRGAQLHHFPTKSDLVLAAIDHLTTARQEELLSRRGALARG